MINNPLFKNKLPQSQIDHYLDLLKKENNKNDLLLASLSDSERKEEENCTNEWLNTLVNSPPEPRFIIESFLKKERINIDYFSQISGIPLSRLKNIMSGHTLNDDECRRVAIVFNEKTADWINIRDSHRDHWHPNFKEPEREATVYCNNCGNSMMGYLGKNTGLVNANVSGGYDSEYIDDMTSYTFSLCETCLHKMFYNFYIPPKIERH